MNEAPHQETIIDKDKVAELLDKSIAFVQRLAEAENISDDEAVDAIAKTIEDTMINTDRPEFLDHIDTSVVKHASENGKKRLIAGMEKFLSQFAQ